MNSDFTVDKGIVTIPGTTDEVPVQIYEFFGVDCTVAISEKCRKDVPPQVYRELLDFIPNRAIINQLIVLDQPVGGLAHLAGEVDCIPDLRRLFLVNPQGNNEATLRAMLHGWAHVAFLDCKIEAHAFHLACQIEMPDSTEEDLVECWSDLLTDLLLETSAEHVNHIGTTMPLRAMALCLALRRLLDQTVNGKSSRHDQFDELYSALQKLAAPRAASQLRGMMKAQDGDQDIALRLIFHFSIEDAELLSELRIIDLSSEPLGEQKLSLLKLAVNVEKLDLSGTGLTKEGLAVIAGLSKLVDLNVANTEVKYLGMLGTPSELFALDLVATRVDDSDIAVLRDWPKLQKVDLRFTSVTDRGVNFLHQTAPRIKIAR